MSGADKSHNYLAYQIFTSYELNNDFTLALRIIGWEKLDSLSVPAFWPPKRKIWVN